ncbi:12969_t:CDS:1, partial [Dentiscutata erythropus]
MKRLMEYTLNLFNDEGNNTYLKIWKSIELPKFWSKLPNPITHQKSFMISDSFHLASIITDLVDTTKCQRRDQ